MIDTEFGGDKLDYFDTYEDLIRRLDKSSLHKLYIKLKSLELNEIQIKSPNLADSFLKVGQKYYIQDKPGGYKAKVKFLGKTIRNTRYDGTGENITYYDFMYDVYWHYEKDELEDMIKNKLITKVK